MRFDRHDEIYHLRHTLFFRFLLWGVWGVRVGAEAGGAAFRKSKFEKPKIKTKTKTETKRVKRPTGRALRAPLAGSPAFVSVFVFVLIFSFSNFAF